MKNLNGTPLPFLPIGCVMFAVAFLVHPASASAQLETTQQPLYVISTSVWPSPVIPVCFEEDGFNYEKQWVREAVDSSWEAASNVRFTGWERCNANTSSGLRVHFQDARGFTDGVGNQLDNRTNGVNLNTWVANTCVEGWTRRRCVDSTAVHEFGHALGFAHEQNRDDRTMECTAAAQGPDGDTAVGPFDMMSVLNYCNPVRNGDGKLSRGDIAGVRQFYGWSDSHAYPLNSTDVKTDLMLWGGSDGSWYEFDREANAGDSMPFGRDGDIPLRMDADGDGLKDLVVWRPSEGKWYRKARVFCSFSGPWYWQSKTCSPGYSVVQWGIGGDIPVPADYDGDGTDDYAVWRPSDGNWHIIHSRKGTVSVRGWGIPGDIPVPGDYDGDGRTDVAVWRPAEGNWYVVNSETWTVTVRQRGLAGDIPVPGDYDGDGRTDFAVWRPSEANWYVLYGTRGVLQRRRWGQTADIPVPGDYDDDGRTDFAVWRPSDATWHVINSSKGDTWQQHWGRAGDIPLGRRSN